MIKRRVLSLSAVLPFAISFFGVFAACGGGNDGDGSEPEIPAAGFEIKDGSAHIVWNGVEGSTGYIIQKSPSRYGGYKDVDFVENTEYVSDDIYAYYRVASVGASGVVTDYLGPFSYELETFGNSTNVYSPDDDISLIQADFDNFYEINKGTGEPYTRGEFRTERFAALFKAGEYDIRADVGYYTSLSGLGTSPDDVTLSKMSVTASVSLCNFWRTAENLSVASDTVWGVSQATSLRRVHVKGNLNLFHNNAKNSTSGGFLADTKVDGKVNSGTQQQWFSRNAQFGSWSGGVWNMAFAGVSGNIPEDGWKNGARYTNIPALDEVREKPFLTFDNNSGYRVFVPAAIKNANGISWSGEAQGKYIPLSDFYVARSDRDTAKTINSALAKGKHLLFSAGIYDLDEPISVTSPNTVVMGLGLATLRPSDKNTQTLIRVADVDGVYVCSLLLDAGKRTQTLLEVGGGNSAADHSQNPTALSDVFFRVGGTSAATTSVEACAVINSNNVTGDNFWIWRADHGDGEYEKDKWNGVGWDVNPAKNGVIVNGDNVTFYGLFVEHFLEYQTVWNGNGGATYFYQSELPYDVPDQNSWLSHGGTVNGYASYKVADGVASHKAYALGVYSYLRDSAVRLENAIECPESGNMSFYHLVTVYLSGNDQTGIDHVINGRGDAVQKGHTQSWLEEYPAKNVS